MNGAGDEFLAGPGFAFDEDGGIRGCDHPNETQNVLESHAGAHDALKAAIHTFALVGLTAAGFDRNRRC
jgi:hypothetical protein